MEYKQEVTLTQCCLSCFASLAIESFNSRRIRCVTCYVTVADDRSKTRGEREITSCQTIRRFGWMSHAKRGINQMSNDEGGRGDQTMMSVGSHTWQNITIDSSVYLFKRELAGTCNWFRNFIIDLGLDAF